ncbi:Nmad5 family putative nucleotide modification protein [Acinetobacter corruptisaponis]|uniref:Nmad5 family putative nucleotide modification protein n=1 Tax=Acinetobacter corruptisaponis TaxID=3045147 RepID=A0ABY8S6J5_9GAMM|nr:Nmad5 family putative nucleotide modification protein [Acinetobacter sp. KCTC 92772]WHP06951.1 Nmad5 family putative nucleotide modification protein [Acinetobacter sp. KCTC 92772]
MSRLTKTLREAMLNTIISHAFDAKEKAASQAKIVAGEKVYQDVYATSLIAMESLPKGFLPKSRYIYIAIGGRQHTVYFSESRLVGARHSDRHGDRAKLFAGDEQVALDYLKTVDACDDLDKQKDSMSKEITALLESVHTFKKLWEVWPESKSLLEKFEEKPTIAILPAIQVNKLNAALGLPVESV